MTDSGTATILFTDLVGSTALSDRLGDDQAEIVRRAYFGLIREAVATTGGKEVKTLGDGHMVVFASALDAVGCAVAIQQAVELHNGEPDAEQLGVRIGINAGDVTFDENDYFGTPVTVAKRLCDQAKGGQIIVSDLVSALVGSRGQFSFITVGALQLRGISQPLPAREVRWRSDGEPDVAVVKAAAAASAATKRKPSRKIMLSAVGAATVVVIALAAVLLSGGNDKAAPQAAAAGSSSKPTSTNTNGTVILKAEGTVTGENGRGQHIVALKKGAAYTISATRRVAGSDLFLELLGPDGHVVAFNDDGGPQSEPRISQIVVPADGTYTVLVTLNDPYVSGGYSLQVVRDPNVPDPSAGPFFGEISTPNEGQVFSFALRGGKPLDAEVIGNNRRNFGAELDLIDPDGKTVKIDKGTGPNGNPVIKNFLVVKTGVWKVLVRGLDENELGSFMLVVEQGA